MNDDTPSSNGSEPRSWFEKLSQAFSGGEPQNREELLDIMTEAHSRDILDGDTLKMVQGAFDVSESHVRDAMVPRGQMVVLAQDSSVAELLPQIVESGHSRFPVVKKDKDEVIGILLAKDMLKHALTDQQTEFSLEELVRPAAFIPESKRLSVLLKEFRSSRNHMAIVVDEYGGVSGLITIEDVLEEIVGEIDDEHDEETEETIVRHGDDRYTVHALTPIDEFNTHFAAELPEQDFDTIGGLLSGELGRLPERGETVSVGEFDFEVLNADDRRLHLLGLRRN